MRDFEAPWLKFPDMPEGSIHWRMGDGEHYRWQFTKWFKALSLAEQGDYLNKFPPPDRWWTNYFKMQKES